MAKIKAIPKMLLIHSIDYEKQIESDGWDATYDDPYTISKVRVEPASSLQRGSDSVGQSASHVVLVDRVNSSHFPDFKPGDRVTFNDIRREVVDVKAHYAFGPKIHHYELELN